MILRDYQIKLVDDAILALMGESQKALIVAPTGTGKSEVIIGILKRLIEIKPDLKACVLINRVQLVDQTQQRFSKHFDVGVVCQSLRKRQTQSAVVVASVHTIEKMDLSFDVLIIDEAHNLPFNDKESRYYRFLSAALDKNKNMRVLGLTATPYRSVGYIFGKDCFFENITSSVGLKEMISSGYLVRPILKHTRCAHDVSHLSIRGGEFDKSQVSKLTSDVSKSCQQVVDAMSQLTDRRKIFWMCFTINQAEVVATKIASFGDDVVVVTSDLDHALRSVELDRFENGSARHCVFVSILSEGYNYPPADALVLLRPIKSSTLYVQTVGRVLRPFKNKNDALILDYGGVVQSCGPLDSPNIQASPGRVSGKITEQVRLSMIFCQHCLTYQDSKNESCETCGKVVASKKEPSLTRKSYSGEILSGPTSKTESHKVSEVVVSFYVSEKNNKIVKVSYSDGFLNTTSEFFPINFGWGLKKAMDRLAQLGLDSVPAMFKNVVAKKCPEMIEFCYEGKYRKVKNVIFRKDDRDRDTKLAQFTA